MDRRFATALVGCLVACAAGDTKLDWEQHLRGVAQPRSQDASGGALEAPTPDKGIAIPHHLPRIRLEQGDLSDSESRRYPTSVPTALHFGWPVGTDAINSLYGRRIDPIDGRERFHYGVDLDAPYGAVVKAAAPGYVVAAGWSGGHGRHIIIEHDGGYRTSYSHLSQILVRRGTRLDTGQPIALVGTSGRSTGPHLHFEVSRFGMPIDPLHVLGRIVAVE